MKNHDNFLGIYENAFSQDFCEQLIEHIDLLEDRGIVIPSQNFKHKIDDNSINFVHFYNLKSWSWIGELFLPNIREYVEEYFTKYSILSQNKFLLYDIKATKINNGGGYHTWHYENQTYTSSNRVLAIQLYLNTVKEGGETEFLYLNKRINAEQGKVLIFPAGFTHTHRGNPPIEQNKYIVTSWAIMQEES